LPSRLLDEHVLAGKLELAVSFSAERLHGVQAQTVADEELFYVAAPDAGGGAMSLADVSRERLVLPCRPHGIRSLLDAAWVKHGMSPNIIGECDVVRALLDSARTGFAATILPWSAFGTAANTGEVCFRLLEDRLTRSLAIVHSESIFLSPASVAVRDLTYATIVQIVAAGSWRGVSLAPLRD
jgi:DNA-binding transcriptional LysR family regulator